MAYWHHSSGAVVIGPGNLIAVVQQKEGTWSLPKGRVQDGEDEESAAVREVFEETGIQDVKIVEKLGEYERPTMGDDDIDEPQMKHLTIYLGVTNQDKLSPIDPENPQAIWLPIAEVPDKLSGPQDAEFFNSIIPKLLKFIA